MFISVTYKDAPELSALVLRRSSSTSTYEPDMSLEKDLLVNPRCPVRIMLEYIRKKCRLGVFTEFDLCDETGVLMGLFSMATYESAWDRFEHKKTYYLVVLKTNVRLTLDVRAVTKSLTVQEVESKRISVLPQLNHDNLLYLDLKAKINQFISGTPQAKPSPPGGNSIISKAGTKSPPLTIKSKVKGKA